MAKLAFGDVELLLVDWDVLARNAVRTILRNAGFHEIRIATTIEEMEQFLVDNTPDLIISESNLPDGDLCKFVRRLRHHEVGTNPFLPVIALTPDPTPELVADVVDTGVDALLAKPISTQQLQDRIIALIEQRKPFVVTSDYIGPDRRKPSERDGSIELLDVPNTLRAKATGEKVDLEMQSKIDSMIAAVNIQKIERYGDQMGWLINEIGASLDAGEIDESIRRNITKLIYVAEDTSRRVTGTKYDHVADLCRSLIKVSQSVVDAGEEPSRREMKLIPPLARAIQKGFESGTTATAREIYASIGG